MNRVSDKTDGVREELIQSHLFRYQIGLETLTKGSDSFIVSNIS